MILLAAITCAAIECVVISAGRWTTQYQFVPGRIWFVIPLCWLAAAAIAAIPSYALSRQWGPVITCFVLASLFAAARIPGERRSTAIVASIAAVFGVVATARLSRWWLSRSRRWAMWGAVIVLAVCAAGAAATCGPERESRGRVAATNGPNVIIIFLDTVRYDAVFDGHGEVKKELAALRRLAAESVVYDNAYAAAPWTLPSHLSAVTGLRADQLGVDFSHQQYREAALTLAQKMRRNGYATSGVAGNTFLNAGTGFTRGFDSYEYATGALDVCRSAQGRILDRSWPRFAATICNWSATNVTRRALRQLRTDAEPYLLVINYMDAHDPYYVEPECGDGPPSYAGALRCVDAHLAPILDRAARSKRETIVAVTSDHGEQFGEHGLFSHGNSLYRELLHVPLMIRTASRRPRRIAEPVSLTQLSSLLTNAGAQPSPVIASGVLDHPGTVTVIRGHWQLIARSDGREELIDLAKGSADLPPLDLLRRDVAALRRSMKPLPESHFRSLGYER